MNNATKILFAMIMSAGFCMGCGKSQEKQDATVKEEAEKVEATAEKWEPETATEKPAAHDVNDGHDHSGHNH